MKRVISFVAGVAALLTISTPAFAQKTGKVAVTATAPSSIGILWHISENVALRPELGLSRSSIESSGATTSSTTTWLVSSGGSVLFYTGKWDNLRAYVSPRFSFSHANTSNSAATTSPDPTAYVVSGSVGGQYSLSDRFGVFGEVGLNYGWQSSTATSLVSPPLTIKSRSFGTGSRIGVAIYF